MTNRITVRTVGNPGLYRDLQESVASETHHRTATGALRRLLKLERDAKVWSRNMGLWGHIDVAINGASLSEEDASDLAECLSDISRNEGDYAEKRALQILSGAN